MIEYSSVKAAPPAPARLRELSLLSPWPMVTQPRHTWLREAAARQQQSQTGRQVLVYLSIMLVSSSVV